MSRDFRYDTESEPNMRSSSPVSEMVERLQDVAGFIQKEHGRVAASACLAIEAASTLATLSTRNAELEREVTRLREALEFYADTSKYPAPFTGGFGELYYDCGQIARRALSTSPQGGETDNERIREGMERILKEQSERDIPFAPQGGEHGE